MERTLLALLREKLLLGFWKICNCYPDKIIPVGNPQNPCVRSNKGDPKLLRLKMNESSKGLYCKLVTDTGQQLFEISVVDHSAVERAIEELSGVLPRAFGVQSPINNDQHITLSRAGGNAA